MSMMLRWFAFALATTLLLVQPPALAEPVDTPPSTPTGLLGRTYSSTSGAIAWERATDDRLVVGYELTRDGRILGTFDALSYIDRSLRPWTSHRYTITSIDTAGQRSAPATVSIFTSPARPHKPTGLRAEAYPSGAVGLFWDETARGNVRYQIEHDGEQIGSSTGTGFRDESVPGPGPRDYRIYGRNGLAQESAAVRIRVHVPEAGGGPAGGSTTPAAARLRALVYSATALELFWERASVPALRYEVQRDGETIGTTDGTSFFDDAVEPGRTHEYKVVTLDRSGAPASASRIRTGSAGGGAPSALITYLPAPTGLRAETYSRTAAELFWERPETIGLRYRILRDGEILTTTNGVSHFDDTRIPGRDHHYAVIALDHSGRASRPSTLLLEARVGEPAPPLITLDNYFQVLSSLPALANNRFPSSGGEAFDVDREGAGIQPIAIGELPAAVEKRAGFVSELALVGTEPVPTGFDVAYRYRCEHGGYFVVAVGEGSPARERTTYEDCLPRPARAETGTTERRLESGVVTTIYTDRVTTTQGMVVERDLRAMETYRREAGIIAFEFDVTRYRQAAFGDIRTYEDFEIAFSAENEGHEFTRRFSYEGTTRLQRVPEGEADVFRATTPIPFASGERQGNYESGRLLVRASDGSELVLDADTGDPATYRVTTRSGGTSASVTSRWLDDNVLPCLNGTGGGELDNCQ